MILQSKTEVGLREKPVILFLKSYTERLKTYLEKELTKICFKTSYRTTTRTHPQLLLQLQKDLSAGVKKTYPNFLQASIDQS